MAQESDLRRARIRFAVIFALVGGALLTLYSFPYAEHGVREVWFARYLACYARLAGLVLRIFDPGVHVVGNDIVGRTSLTVAKNCDAMDVSLLFSAAIVAFPAPWSRRLMGIAVGVGALTVVNVLRIASLYFVDLRWPAAFETVHAEVWPLVIVALAATAFLAWSRWAQPPSGPSARPPDAHRCAAAPRTGLPRCSCVARSSCCCSRRGRAGVEGSPRRSASMATPSSP